MIEIKHASINDVIDIVDIHLDAFKDFFLSSLGRDFLIFYYSCLIKNKESVVILAKINSKIIGFSAATIDCKGFNIKLIKQNFMLFFFTSIKLLFFNPKALIRLAKNLTKKSANIEDSEDYAELFSIGVSKPEQGKGIGKVLLQYTEDTLQKLGVKKLSLSTDYYDNDSSLNFYKSMGYSTLYDFTTYPNRKMYRLIKNL